MVYVFPVRRPGGSKGDPGLNRQRCSAQVLPENAWGGMVGNLDLVFGKTVKGIDVWISVSLPSSHGLVL